MRNLLGLLLILTIGFTSCEGRRTTHQSLAKSVEEFKAKHTFEKITYIPEVYNEIVTDTLLSNGFRVKIKTFSDMENAVIKTLEKDNVSKKTHYREHIGALEIYYRDKLITETNIDKSNFFEVEHKDFWDSSVLKAVNLNFFSSLDNELLINVSYCIPETSDCKEFIVSVDNIGNYTSEELTYNSK